VSAELLRSRLLGLLLLLLLALPLLTAQLNDVSIRSVYSLSDVDI